MPTQSSTYNSRVTDEALEKRFRDTFRSQGGSELVDDLYAQGVIVPIVDFTNAATGQTLEENLQTAWDFTTGQVTVTNGTSTITSTAGFWRLQGSISYEQRARSGGIRLSDGITTKTVFSLESFGNAQTQIDTETFGFIVFVRSGDTLSAFSDDAQAVTNVFYRQIATVSGDLVDPSGFTSS